ncbi:MAG TPA: hypothetical protein VL119_03825 [Acidimicrobiia bacterium]|nr:hypothetical protein [Acidimicrobiia bacterium]
MLIAVLNQSTKITDDQAGKMTEAIASQVRNDAAPIWDKTAAAVVYYGTFAPGTTKMPSNVPKQAHGITIVDDIPDQPKGVLGYHTEDQGGKIWGIVAASPSLDNGAKALTGDWSVASILSHEVLEMFVDPNCNLWASDSRGKVYSFEVCDPVEAPTYNVGDISVSNFVTPAWFDPLAAENKKTQFDKCNHLHDSFACLPGGYMVYASEGKEQQHQGDRMPEWRMRSKDAWFSRTNRRKTQPGQGGF